MHCYDLEVMSLNPDWVELEVCSTSVYVVLDPNISIREQSYLKHSRVILQPMHLKLHEKLLHS